MTATATRKPSTRRKYDGPSPEEKMVAQLCGLIESGVNPWRKEWKGSGAHRNLLTGHVYTGCNPAILEWGQAARQSDYSLWVGPSMLKSKGWHPKKGSKGCYILAPKPIAIEEKNETTGESTLKALTLFKPVCLFNVADVEGDGLAELIAKQLEGCVERPEDERLAGAFAQLRQWKVKTNHGGDRAYYVPSDDQITMPERRQFVKDAAYLAAWAHEQIHSTGHHSRLSRPMAGRTQDKLSYAREELIAELGAFIVCNRLQVDSNTENHAAYLEGWASVLKSGPKVLFKVLSEATKAANLIAPETTVVHDA
jgi:antirestriction protein ArdC